MDREGFTGLGTESHIFYASFMNHIVRMFIYRAMSDWKRIGSKGCERGFLKFYL